MGDAKRDANYVTTLLAVSNVDGVTPVVLWGDASTHRLLVSIGSLSSVVLTPTETPNGNIKVFTFVAAIAQPSFLVIDNALVRATSKSGTVNWTWNQGATQATLVGSPPPSDDIVALQ